MTAPTTPRPRVRGSDAPRGQRLASSVRLPWLAGLASLLLLALLAAVLAGRGTSVAGVERAVLDAERAVAVGTANSVRRTLNEGVDDLAQAAALLEEGFGEDLVSTAQAAEVLAATGALHPRYLALGVVDAATGRTLLTAPGEPAPALLGPLPDDGPLTRVLDDGRLVQSVPLRAGSGLLVAAVYDPAFLVPALFPAPEAFYVVDAQRRAVTSPGGVGLTRALPDGFLTEAVERADRAGALAEATRTTGDRARVVAAAPVEGFGPAGDTGLEVVSVREVAALALGERPYRAQGLLVALLLAGLAAGVSLWLWRGVLQPLLALQDTAERVAYGDLSRPVLVDRYDEVGAVGRAFERLRLALIRAQVQDLAPRHVTRAEETS